MATFIPEKCIHKSFYSNDSECNRERDWLELIDCFAFGEYLPGFLTLEFNFSNWKSFMIEFSLFHYRTSAQLSWKLICSNKHFEVLSHKSINEQKEREIRVTCGWKPFKAWRRGLRDKDFVLVRFLIFLRSFVEFMLENQKISRPLKLETPCFEIWWMGSHEISTKLTVSW